MAWTSDRENPLIIYPDVATSVEDVGFVSGAFGGTDQWTRSGTNLPTMVTGVGEQFGYAVKIDPAGDLSKIAALAKKASFANTSNPVYIYARLKATAGTGVFTFRLAYYDSGVGYVYSDNFNLTLGTDLPVDSGWHTVRIDSNWLTYYTFLNARYVAFEEVGARTGTAHTYTVYIDWIGLGHALDGQDMNQLNNVGTMAVHPYRYGSTAAGTFGKAVSGKYSARRFHSGYRSGSLQFTPFAFGDVTEWNTFLDYCVDGTEFTLAYNQDDWSRDYIGKAVLNMDSNGLDQVAGSPYWRGAIDWKEVP